MPLGPGPRRAFPRLRFRPVHLLLLALATPGCAAVPAWQRGDLARPCMASPFGAAPLREEHRVKVVEVLTGGTLPAAAPGGGCGCTR